MEEFSASTNNLSSRRIVNAESSQVVKESAFQPIVITESGQVVKESASQPNIIVESSEVQRNIRFKDP